MGSNHRPYGDLGEDQYANVTTDERVENFKNTNDARYLGAGLYRGHSVYMPPVPLPEAERGALAAYIESILPKKGAAK